MTRPTSTLGLFCWPRRSCRMLALKNVLERASDSRDDSWLVRTTW